MVLRRSGLRLLLLVLRLDFWLLSICAVDFTAGRRLPRTKRQGVWQKKYDAAVAVLGGVARMIPQANKAQETRDRLVRMQATRAQRMAFHS